ncbi:hypothetical protein [Photorhabdus tasmaniensis]|uniref:hypothetical protein n=1 Tax=Photorhabdus tasmaniensis TaxID=1004159 RepID=UPI0010CE411B|nr:hypothetical protein [Photorhabdus tasmaniensis]
MLQTQQINCCIVLASRPHGFPISTDFRLEQQPIPEIKQGEGLLCTAFRKCS